jgi:predicted transcriptional regulator
MTPTSEVELLEQRILKHIREIQPQTAQPTMDYLCYKIRDYDEPTIRAILQGMIRDYLVIVTSDLRIIAGD